MKATTTIKLTKEEAERIATALNFYQVEYTMKKREEKPESEFWHEEWWNNVQLSTRIFKAKQRLADK